MKSNIGIMKPDENGIEDAVMKETAQTAYIRLQFAMIPGNLARCDLKHIAASAG